MKPTKTVYVKNYTRCLDDVKSEPTDGYLEYPIYKIPMELLSFDEDVIQKWHPEIDTVSLQLNGAIYFQIKNVTFRVEESQKESDTIEIQTSFQTLKLSEGKLYNNLNLFKEFQKSFVLHDLSASLIDYENIDSNGIQFTISNVYYSSKDRQPNVLHVSIQSDQLSEFHLNYVERDDGTFEYIGIGYGGLEVWYDYDHNINLEREMRDLKLKIELVEFIKQKLYDIYGVGMETKLTKKQEKASKEAKETARLFKNFYKKS